MVQGKIIKRFFGQPTTDHNADPALTYDVRIGRELTRPTFSQNVTYSTGSPLTCVDIAPTGNYAVVAGEKVFKTLKVDGAKIEEGADLRAAIVTPGDTLSAINDQLNIGAVRWAHGEIDTSIVAASANGRITIYDLNRITTGFEVGRIREHQRQVHKLAINPFRGNLLLSASQDGTVRFFDIKAPAGRTGLTFINRAIFKCNADSVRDVKWNPNRGFEFACATGSGTVQHWDTRNQKAPLLKINAHDSACLTLSWHPDGEHIVSGGLDQQCYVWDLSRTAEKRQKPKYTLATPAPVSIVTWRPPSWSSSAQAQRAAQIVTVYDDQSSLKTQNSTVHIWDVARPGLPFKEIPDFETSPTGLQWQQTDILWTVGREGEFRQNDLAFAPRVIDRRSLSTFDFSPAGEVLMLLEERQGRPRYPNTGSGEKPVRARISMTSQSPSGQLSISRSDSEEDTAGSFLGPKLRSKKKSKRHNNTRSATPLSTTPPSAADIATIMKLDDSVKATGPYKPAQVMAIGHAPSAMNRDVFKFLSSSYLQRMVKDLQDAEAAGPNCAPINERLTAILESFAKSAELVGQYRMAQTWKIFSYTMNLLLVRRAHYHRDLRLAQVEADRILQETQEKQQMKDSQRLEKQHFYHDETPTRTLRPKTPENPKEASVHLAARAARAIIADEESTSTMTTPLARPIVDSQILDTATHTPLPQIEQDEFSLPAAAHSPSKGRRKSHGNAIGEDGESIYSFSSDEGYDFYGLGALTPTPATAMSIPPRKAPLRLEAGLEHNGTASRPASMLRHDSNESFQMFSTSADSGKSAAISHAEGRVFQSNDGVQSSDFDSSWDSSIPTSGPRHRQSFDSQDSSIPSDELPSQSGRATYHSHAPPSLPLHRASIPSASATHPSETHASPPLSPPPLSPYPHDPTSPSLLPTDYHPHPTDPPFLPPALDPHTLLPRTIHFTLLTSPLSATLMILLLLPHLHAPALDPLLAAALPASLHARLQTARLFVSAALLRNLAYPTYPTVYASAQTRDVADVAYACLPCGRGLRKGEALRVGRRLVRCLRCGGGLDGCAVCRGHEEPEMGGASAQEMKEAGRLWWWCQGCGHGGHGVCMRAWHGRVEGEEGEGCCPVEGCLHACLPGRWREEWGRERREGRSGEMGRAVREGRGVVGGRGVVRRDEREAPVSRAVELVRGTLGGGAERRKSVKVVAPGEE